MYPDLKFMNSSTNDVTFAPLENIEINNGFFIPEEFIEEFRTSSISTNPLKFDFRETLINSNIENKEEELRELIQLYEDDLTTLRDDLKSYNSNSSETSFENLITTPLSSDILRELDLNIDEETLEVNTDFEENYSLSSRHQNKCNANIIFNNILNSNPRIMNILTAYNIPFPVAKQILMQVIKQTINHCSQVHPHKPTPTPGYPFPNFGSPSYGPNFNLKEMGDSNDV